MAFRSLRTRIVVFFVALLAVVQIAAFALVNSANSTNAHQKIESELNTGERVFARLMEQNRERLSLAARVMAADYALREAIATGDIDTVLSALDNHGRRVHANVVMLLSLNGEIIADTSAAAGPRRAFEFPQLVEAAQRDGAASSIELRNDRAYQLFVVPVLAPLPVAWIVLGFTVDHELARAIEAMTSLEVSFLQSQEEPASWRVLASTLERPDIDALAAALPPLPAAARVDRIGSGSSEQQLRVIRLNHFGGTAVTAVLQRSVAEAIAAFDRLKTTLIALGAISLVLSILGSIFIALSITRPIRALSRAAARIEEGDYANSIESKRADEIGLLAGSLDHMRVGIAVREREILRLAYRDTLTGLPNRSLFNDQLSQAIDRACRAGTRLTVLMMDLDRFKYVNDTLGHSVGDHVLQEVATRIERLLESKDAVARLGGDEFAVVLEEASETEAVSIAQRLLVALEEPIDYEGQPLDVGGSIGIAHHPQHGADAETLLRNADIAMYVAKRNKSGYAIYDAEYDTHQQQHLSLLSEIRRAVDQNELRVYYQPKVSLASSAPVAVEALLRWQHPQRGFIPPAEFIPFAEHTGYIKVLTRWVLEESIKQCGLWRRAGVPLLVSVNISTRDLLNRELPDLIAALLRRHDTPASMVCLEITESGFMEDPGHAHKVLARLHRLGLHLSIDDYGTGYSSLSYIARLPVNELKIDRSFVQRMTADPTTSMIVRSTIELGHSLGLRVVAEGVEDDEGFRALRDLGCDQAQGYYMSPPLPAQDLESWLRNSRWGQLYDAGHDLDGSRLLPAASDR